MTARALNQDRYSEKRDSQPADSAKTEPRIRAGNLSWHVESRHVESRHVETRKGSSLSPTILLLHGTGASSHSWRHLVDQFGQHYNLIMPDLPGHGRTEAPADNALSLPAMARATADLLAVLNTKVDYVIGHSAGAAIAIRMVLDGTIAPKAIIGINAALKPFNGPMQSMFSSLARLLVLNPFVPGFFSWRASNLDAIRRLIDSTGSRLSDSDLQPYQKLYQDQRHIRSTLAMMAHWDLTSLQKALPSLATPLHLIVAQGDKAVPPEDARGIKANRPATELHFMPRVGHLCHEEKPAEAAALIQSIISAAEAKEGGA